MEALERRRLLAVAVSVNVNFQPAGASVPAGYLADTGATFANRGNGQSYGWNLAASDFTRDRNSSVSPDQRYDTLVHTQMYGNRTWELAVPSGSYNVRIVGGDASYSDSTIRFAAENAIVADGKLSSAQHFIDATKTVTVSDGKLTISNASGAVNNKLCFVEVTPVDAGAPSVSITATDSNASESGPNSGVFKVTRTGSTSSSLTVGYLIGGSADNGIDYNTLSGSVTIAAGASSANITITPKSDGKIEGTETVALTLQPPAGYSGGGSFSTISIIDADSSNTGTWPTSWTAGAAIPKPRWESASVLMDGKIFVFGGWMSAGSVGTQQYDVYDIAANKWTTLGYMPVPHTHSGFAADNDNHVIYFAGGLTGGYPGVPSNKVYKYNTLNDTWSDLPAMPQVQSSGALALVNNELHYFGGVGENHDLDIGRHVYLDLGNLAAGWKSAPDMPNPRDHFAHAVLNGKIIAIGGEYGHDKLHLQQNFVDSYDPIAKKWTSLAPLPIAKSHDESSTYVTPQGTIIVAGGQIDDWKGTDQVVEYNPATNSWATIGKLPFALEGPVVLQYGNQIIVTTGKRNGGPTTNTFIGDLG